MELNGTHETKSFEISILVSNNIFKKRFRSVFFLFYLQIKCCDTLC